MLNHNKHKLTYQKQTTKPDMFTNTNTTDRKQARKRALAQAEGA